MNLLDSLNEMYAYETNVSWHENPIFTTIVRCPTCKAELRVSDEFVKLYGLQKWYEVLQPCDGDCVEALDVIKATAHLMGRAAPEPPRAPDGRRVYTTIVLKPLIHPPKEKAA